MSARYLVVDGHSVIFSWPELRGLHDRNRASARRTLAGQLGRLHDTSSWRVTLVLDGKMGGPAREGPARTDEMVVCYGTRDQTADSIIERLVAGSGRAGEILVVTADEVEKRTVESLGATGVSPEWLRQEMERCAVSFFSELDRVHRSARWK
jgi:predicted RNA-binding protein with PIN domain